MITGPFYTYRQIHFTSENASDYCFFCDNLSHVIILICRSGHLAMNLLDTLFYQSNTKCSCFFLNLCEPFIRPDEGDRKFLVRDLRPVVVSSVVNIAETTVANFAKNRQLVERSDIYT